MKSLTLALLVSLTVPAFAQIGESRLAWNPPRQRVDGTPLAPEEIAYYLFKLGTLEEEVVKVPYTVRALKYGTYTYTVRCCDVNGLCSVPSSVKTFTIKSAPKKPLYPSAKVL